MTEPTKSIRSIITRHRIPIIAFAILLMFPLIFPSKYASHVLTIAWIWGLASLGWDFSYGYAGLLNFGYVGFFGLGAYFTLFLFLWFNLTPWIGIFIASALAAVLGIGIAWLTARTRGIYFALTTFAVPSILMVLFKWQWEITGGSGGISFPWSGENLLEMQFRSPIPYYYISITFLILFLVLIGRILGMKLGYYLRAIGADEDAAKSIGINTFKTRLISMGISTFIAGVAGGIYVVFLHYINPDDAFGWAYNIQFMLAAVLGGVGTLWGPLIGTLIFIPLSEVVKLLLEEQFPKGIHLIAYGVVLMLVITLMPKGVYVKLRQIFVAGGRKEDQEPQEEDLHATARDQ